ncbi:MAG: MEDS domain-containing protein, partial [Rhizobacter sp.]
MNPAPLVQAAEPLGPHIVQFYEQDEFLIHQVADFLDEALRSAGVAVAIATPEHRVQLQRRLQGIGSADGTAWYPGELVTLDARETLSTLMVGGMPDEALFEANVGTVIARAAHGGERPVRAFGEMVALLFADGTAWYPGELVTLDARET